MLLGMSAIAGGCSGTAPGITRGLGNVPYDQAFAASKEVMGQYFSVESASPETGKIKSRPLDLPPARERLVSATSRRQIATLTLKQGAGEVIARLAVANYSQGQDVYEQTRPMRENYSGVPDQTLAEGTAAVTPAQNQAWRLTGYDAFMERTVLEDIFHRLHPAALPANEPTSEPASK